MRLLRGLGGALLWIVAGLLGVVGLVLCVTIILLPLGIPLVRLSGRLLRTAVQLMLPRAMAHPVKSAKKQNRKIGSAASRTASNTATSARKTARRMRKRIA